MAAPLQLVGQTLGHYRILEQIGAGGMGVVYRARDEQLERDVAIKVLPAGTLADEAARKRFRREALALAKLNHSNIATIFEFSSQNSTDYLVTEYISGQPLDQKLSTGELSEKEVVGLGIQLAQGLSAAHEHGIVHRDLKPANLRLTSDGRLKILDFGLAQLMPHSSEGGLTATLTQSQEVSGTLPYMSPEQLRGGMADARTDIWAAGTVLYEVATARRPFEERVPTALTDDIIHKTPLPPRNLKPTISPKLEAVILKCLEKEPANRYQSAQELQTDLERLRTGVTPIAARRQLWPMLTVAAVLLALLGAGGVFYLRRSPKLTEKDTIVLADFENKTGDVVFDGTVKQALSLALEQSPFLNILPDRKAKETLRLMGRSSDEPLTDKTALEICLRTDSAAVLAGSIASLGSQYVLGLSAVNCRTGDTLALEQTQASKKEQVLEALDHAAAKLRERLGESLNSIQKFDTPIAQATTSSFEALRVFSLAVKAKSEKGDAASIPFLKRAIALDPDFAMAYTGVGVSYSNLGETGLASQYLQKAYELRDRASEVEKFRIETFYYDLVTGELPKAVGAYELWAQEYPRRASAHSNLGSTYFMLGQYERALAENLTAARLSPDDGVPYGNLIGDYAPLNRWEEAKATYQQALVRKLDNAEVRGNEYGIAFLEGDVLEMAHQVAWATGKPGVEDAFLSSQADTEAFYGRLEKARELSRRAVESARRNDEKEIAAQWHLDAALREAEFGNLSEARQQAAAALVLASTRDVQVLAGLALAHAGDSAHARRIADELEKRFPRNTMINGYWLPTIRAGIEIQRNNPSKAIELLQAASPYDLANPPPGVGGLLHPVYVRGQAYLLLHQGDQAAAEFQKFLDHRGVVMNCPLGALAHLGMARASVLQGDTTKARSAYQDFLTLWKDADPDIPILKEAKAEYAKLQ
jgi:serine/threonine protein kinase/tetratricopeptide (TPR) repeat protein